MRYLSLGEILELHRTLIEETGGANGIRDLGSVESALAQPLLTFGGQDLYPSIESKAAAVCLSLVLNHPFVDGNKRIGHAAMEVFLMLNNFELSAVIDNAEQVMLRLASGQLSRDELVKWVKSHLKFIE